MKIKVAFLGTPEFAVPTLETFLNDQHTYELTAVISQPDRPAGRNLESRASRVKQIAREALDTKGKISIQFPILTPESVNDRAFIQSISNRKPDVAVVVAFGQILSQEFLDIFPFGAVNLHASLLPRWRGAAPIAWALLSQDPATGVTMQKIVRELDAGDIISKSEMVLDESWDSLKLYSELSKRGADLVRRTLPDYIAGKIIPVPQDPRGVSLAPKIRKEQGLISWTMKAQEITSRIRAFNPWPGVWTTRDGKTLKIFRAEVVEHASEAPPGSLVGQDRMGFIVKCGGSTCLHISVVQPESRARMAAAEYIRGYPFKVGDVLGK